MMFKYWTKRNLELVHVLRSGTLEAKLNPAPEKTGTYLEGLLTVKRKRKENEKNK